MQHQTPRPRVASVPKRAAGARARQSVAAPAQTAVVTRPPAARTRRARKHVGRRAAAQAPHVEERRVALDADGQVARVDVDGELARLDAGGRRDVAVKLLEALLPLVNGLPIVLVLEPLVLNLVHARPTPRELARRLSAQLS